MKLLYIIITVVLLLYYLVLFVHTNYPTFQTANVGTTTADTDGIDIARYCGLHRLNINGEIVVGNTKPTYVMSDRNYCGLYFLDSEGQIELADMTTDASSSDASYATALEDQKKYNQIYKEWCATHPAQTFEEFKKCKNI